MEMISAKRLALYAGVCLLLPLGLLLLPRSRPHPGVVPAPAPPDPPLSATKPPPGVRSAWTFGEAREALKAQPDNSYLQYVVLQLAHNTERLAEIAGDIPLFGARPAGQPIERFGLLASIASVQQQLQAEAMGAGQAPQRPAVDEAVAPTGALKALPVMAMPARPWRKLLAGQQPVVSALARAVPADFYLAEFRSLERLVAVLDTGRPWAEFLGVQAAEDATDRQVRRRLQEQLAFEPDPALQQLVDQVALTGSDPFLVEGTDATVLIQVKKAAVAAFQARSERGLAEAAGRTGAWRDQGSHLGVKYDFVRTANRRISAYAATLTDGGAPLHVRSNSRVALHRIIAVVRGRSTGSATPALGDTAEFRYVRALLPAGAPDEDGLVYVPSAMLVHLLDAHLQITEARRRVGYTHLRMIAHAAALYRTQIGKSPASLDELARAGCVPGAFNEGMLASPFRGGKYTLNDDGTAGVCSVLGTADFLTPCCELPTAPASADEAAAYNAFARDFAPRARRWFGPVALRLQSGYRQLRVEALYLPPAGNPAHAALAGFLGGEPAPLDPLPVAKRTIASFNLRLDRQRWVREHLDTAQPHIAASRAAVIAAAMPGGFPTSVPWAALAGARSPALTAVTRLGVEPARLRAFLERGIGNQAGLHFYDASATVDVSVPTLVNGFCGAGAGEPGLLDKLGVFADVLSNPAYVAIPVKDVRVVDDFLAHLDAGLAKQVPTWRGELFHAPSQAAFYHLTPRIGIPVRVLGVHAGPLHYRILWARIGDGLYIANQPAILDDLRAAQRMRLQAGSADRGPVGQAMFKLRPAAWSLALPGFRLGWEEANRAACHRNLGMLTAAARAYSFTPPVNAAALDHETRQRLVVKQAAQLYGCDCACPDGGHYVLADDGKSFTCTVHGALTDPRQLDRPAEAGAAGSLMGSLADATATMTVTPVAIRVVLTLTRK